ncbi:hypothetical protein PCE1_002322 [Barthelona sp. PCE]
MSYWMTFRYIILGDSTVGKSCLMHRFTDRRYRENAPPATVGVDFGSRFLQLEDHVIKLLLWDSAGQECFRSIAKSYVRNTIGILLAYDISSRESFNSVAGWLEDIHMNADPDAIIMLVGNKSDLEDEREVSYEEGEKFAKDNDLHFFIETSAKTADNVDEAFEKTASLIYRLILEERIEPSDSNGLKPGPLYGGVEEEVIVEDTNEEVGGTCTC